MCLKIPVTEVRVEESGFVVREALNQDFRIDHRVMEMATVDQWRILYDHLLSFDVLGGDLSGILSYGKDPLLLIHYLMQRAPDTYSEHRGCLATKYPV